MALAPAACRSLAYLGWGAAGRRHQRWRLAWSQHREPGPRGPGSSHREWMGIRRRTRRLGSRPAGRTHLQAVSPLDGLAGSIGDHGGAPVLHGTRITSVNDGLVVVG